MQTSFVMTGGGSLGAVQVGMLQALLEAGVAPDRIVGVSAGALNGALIAADPSLDTALRLETLWRATSTRKALGLSWRSVLAMLGMGSELGHPRGLRQLLEEALPLRSFESLRKPLHVLCAEIASGTAVVLSQGDLIHAVVASAAVPGVFPPVEHEGQLLVDGAVASASPLAVAVSLATRDASTAAQAHRIVVLPCGIACSASAVPRHAIGRAMHAITLLGSRQLRQDIERFGAQHDIAVVPPLCPLAHSPYDYSAAGALIQRARESTRRWLQEGGLDRRGVPHEMLEHRH